MAPPLDDDLAARTAQTHGGNPRYAAQVYLRDRYPDDYGEFIACRAMDKKTASNAIHQKALQDLAEYHDKEFVAAFDYMIEHLSRKVRG